MGNLTGSDPTAVSFSYEPPPRQHRQLCQRLREAVSSASSSPATWRDCSGEIAVEGLPWRDCRGEIAVEGLPWGDCRGGIAVERLPWRDCRGEIAVEGLPWGDCRGEIAVERLPWRDCRGEIAVEGLPWRDCRGEIAVERLPNRRTLLTPECDIAESEEDGTEVVTTDRYILDVKTELKHVVEFDKLAPQDRSGNVLRELFLAEKAYLQDEVNWGAGAMMQFQGPKPELGKPTCETRAEGNQGQASSFTQEASQGVERHFSYVTWQEYFKTKAAISEPCPDNYFQNRMFLWAPMRMWKISLSCPKCNLQLTHAGLYPKAREVVDIDSSKDILQQLDPCHRNLFPAVLTKNAALDKKCVTLMKPQTLGNSSSYIHQAMEECHSEAWAKKCLQYLSDCEVHMRRVALTRLSTTYAEPPGFRPLPLAQWFETAHTGEIMNHQAEMKEHLRLVESRTRLTRGHPARRDLTLGVAAQIAESPRTQHFP
ncbi:hypothetical protein Bbelb_291270 [Branchiostoma belcheri]|nr:hypothetical protein Bbelb_291270 [Branchiostoma belcheri]